jgi:large subunit ribosomal protein L15
MRLHDLSPAANSRKTPKRLGRGIGSGTGKTSGKGHKGQWARSGGGVRIGFEGGQMPLMRRIPKRGFDNNWRKVYTVVNLSDLEVFENGDVVDSAALLAKGVISKIEPYGLKVLADGKLTKKITVKAQKFSKAALEKLEKIGGKAEVL